MLCYVDEGVTINEFFKKRQCKRHVQRDEDGRKEGICSSWKHKGIHIKNLLHRKELQKRSTRTNQSLPILARPCRVLPHRTIQQLPLQRVHDPLKTNRIHPSRMLHLQLKLGQLRSRRCRGELQTNCALPYASLRQGSKATRIYQ